jgi:tetratricopeptide (TPR) repeat protein
MVMWKSIDNSMKNDKKNDQTGQKIENNGGIGQQTNIGKVAHDVIININNTPPFRLENRIRPYSEGSSRTYFFGSGLLGFYGRDDEKKALDEFITSPDKLSMWIITGIGGTGKSKLAFERCNYYREEKVYEAGFWSKDVEELPNDWKPKKPTIIVIDYAAERIEHIKQLISLYESAREWEYPVRIILIERDSSLLDEKLSELSSTQRATYQSMLLHEKKPLNLEPLSKKDILKIMRHILYQGNSPSTQSYTDDYLWELFEKIDNKKRTLFAIYLAETLRDHDQNDGELSGEDLLKHIYKTEDERWKSITKGNNSNEYAKYLHLVYLATLMGGCYEAVLKDKEMQDVLPAWKDYVPTTYEEIIGDHCQKKNFVSPIEPDIFGEYALLLIEEAARKGSRGEQDQLKQLRTLAWNRPKTNVSYVLYRMFRDFPSKGNVTQFFDKCVEDADVNDPKVKQRVARAYYNKGNALGELGKPEEALEAFDKAIELDPKFAQAYYNKGNALGKLGKPEEALVAYEKAIEIDQKDAQAYYNKGNALGELGKPEEALEAFDKAIELDPKFAQAYYNKGNALGKLGKPEEAIEAFDKAIELDQKDAQAYNNKGTALWGLGKLEEALVAYEKAIELDQKDAQAYNNKGTALWGLGKLEEALVAYEKAIEIDPKLAQAYNNKGTALWETEET